MPNRIGDGKTAMTLLSLVLSGCVGSMTAPNSDSDDPLRRRHLASADLGVSMASDLSLCGTCGPGFVCVSDGCVPAGGTVYYVSTSGSDSNNGSNAAPFATIQKAVDVARGADTVLVEDGTYETSEQQLAVITHGGSAAAGYLTIRSKTKWGAKLSGQNNVTRQGFILYQNPAYVRIEGFEMFGFDLAGVNFYNNVGSNHVEIVGNKIHDIGRRCGSSQQGISGVLMSSYNLGGWDDNVLFDGNMIYAIGNYNYRTGENGCTTPNLRRYNHGLYMEGTNLTVHNNVFFNITDGWAVQFCDVRNNYIKVENNTMAYGNPDYPGQIVLCPDASGTEHDIAINNNIFYQPTGSAVDVCCSGNNNYYQVPGLTIGANIVTGGTLLNYTLNGTSAQSGNYLNQDPGLNAASIDPTTADYRVAPAGFAIDRGLTLSGFNWDFLRTARPLGAAWDVGAYENR